MTTLQSPLASGVPPTLAPTVLTFAVLGTPGPQGSKKHVGGGRMVESSKKVAPWREAVKWAAQQQICTPEPLDGPLSVHIVFTLKKPVSAPKTRRVWPVKYPDVDKLLRSTFDGISETGIWHNDSQVVRVIATKVYVGDNGSQAAPGAVISVWQVAP